MKTQQLTIVDQEFLIKLDSDIQVIKAGLQNIKAIPPEEFLTADEYMQRIKIGRWKFDMLISQGLLQYKKIGRKYYIPIDQVTKFFSGQMQLDSK